MGVYTTGSCAAFGLNHAPCPCEPPPLVLSYWRHVGQRPQAGAAPADIEVMGTPPSLQRPRRIRRRHIRAHNLLLFLLLRQRNNCELSARELSQTQRKTGEQRELGSRAHHLTAQWRRPSAKSRAFVGCDSVPMGRSGPLVSLWPYLQNGRAHGPQRVTRESFGSDRGGRSNMPRPGSNDHGRRAVDHSTGYACSCRTVMHPVECCRSSPSSQRRISRAGQLSARSRKVPLKHDALLLSFTPIAAPVTWRGPSSGSQTKTRDRKRTIERWLP
jgi:hypothetical protein